MFGTEDASTQKLVSDTPQNAIDPNGDLGMAIWLSEARLSLVANALHQPCINGVTGALEADIQTLKQHLSHRMPRVPRLGTDRRILRTSVT